MTARIDFLACGVLFLVLILAGTWLAWGETSPRDAWTLDEPARILTAFDPSEELNISYRLRNTARVPLRILGRSAC